MMQSLSNNSLQMAPNLSFGRISTELNGEGKAILPPQAQAQRLCFFLTVKRLNYDNVCKFFLWDFLIITN